MNELTDVALRVSLQPGNFDFIALLISCILSIGAIIVALVVASGQGKIALKQRELTEQQNKIASEQTTLVKQQNEISSKQAEIAEQQNNIALFGRRLDVSLELEKLVGLKDAIIGKENELSDGKLCNYDRNAFLMIVDSQALEKIVNFFHLKPAIKNSFFPFIYQESARIIFQKDFLFQLDVPDNEKINNLMKVFHKFAGSLAFFPDGEYKQHRGNFIEAFDEFDIPHLLKNLEEQTKLNKPK